MRYRAITRSLRGPLRRLFLNVLTGKEPNP